MINILLIISIMFKKFFKKFKKRPNPIIIHQEIEIPGYIPPEDHKERKIYDYLPLKTFCKRVYKEPGLYLPQRVLVTPSLSKKGEPMVMYKPKK